MTIVNASLLSIAFLTKMLISVNVVESIPLASNEFNQSGRDFIKCNQNYNTACYREHLETQCEDTFESIYARISNENPSFLNERSLESARIVMDPCQAPAKTSSKLHVDLFTNNWKSSNVLSCIEVYCCAIGSKKVNPNEQCAVSTIDLMKKNSNLIAYCKPDTGSNYYKKAKETLIEKLDREGKGLFQSKHLKSYEDFSNDASKFFFMLDGKADCIRSKGWKISAYWHNLIGKDKRSVKIRKVDSHHKPPQLKTHELFSIVKKIASYENSDAIECFSNTRFCAELKLILTQAIDFINKAASCNITKDEELARTNNFTLKSESTKSRSIAFIPKVDTYDNVLEPLCQGLDKVAIGDPALIRDYELDYVDKELSNNEMVSKLKSSSSATDYVGTSINKIKKKFRKSLKEGIRHSVIYCNYQVGNNLGSLKFAIKVNDKNDEENKIKGVEACEENIPKFTTRFYKCQVKSAMAIASKSKLMSSNSKASFLIKAFTEQTNIAHALNKKEMKRLADDFAVLEALEKDDMISDALLDCKTFYGKHSIYDEFFEAMKTVIMDQAVAEEKRHNEWGYCSDSISMRHWHELAKEKCSSKAAIPTENYLVYQFAPAHPRRNISKHFNSRFGVVKKTQTKTRQNNNPDMRYANCNAKNVRKVLVSRFNKEHAMMISCDDKCMVKIGSPGVPLALCPKTKAGWVAKEVDASAADHDAVIKSPFVPSAIFNINIPNNHNLGSFYGGEVHAGAKDSAIHPTSAARQVMEIGNALEDQLKSKMFLFINADGGGDRNRRFDRVQASLLWLAYKFNLEKIVCLKPAAGGSAWNQAEHPMASLNNALCSAALCRKETNTNLEKELVRCKSAKCLMQSDVNQVIKDACIESIEPALTQSRGRFGNCAYSKKKMQTRAPISNEHIVEEMNKLSKLFSFLPDNLEKCKSNDIFKKTEEGRQYQLAHFRSNMRALQLVKVDGCNCAWCVILPKNKEECYECKGFIPPPRPIPSAEETAFEGAPELRTEIDLDEIHCPSKAKKHGTNPSTSNMIRKNLVQSRIQCRACFKCRAIFAFNALSKEDKLKLQEFIEARAHQCGYPLFPENNIEFADLNFGTNTLETNRKLTCSDKIESQMDRVCPSCVCCGKEELADDVPRGYRPMRPLCIKTKELAHKGRKKVDKGASIKRAVSNAEVKRKRQTALEFTAVNKKVKVTEEQNETVSVNIKKEYAHEDSAEAGKTEAENKQVDDDAQVLNRVPSNSEPISSKECDALLEKATRALGLARRNVAGLGDCQLLAARLAYFGRRKYDESDRNRNIVNFKCSMINAYHRNLGNDIALVDRRSFWRKSIQSIA